MARSREMVSLRLPLGTRERIARLAEGEETQADTILAALDLLEAERNPETELEQRIGRIESALAEIWELRERRVQTGKPVTLNNHG